MPESTLTLAVLAPATDSFERTVGVVRDLLYSDLTDVLNGMVDVVVSVDGVETYKAEVDVCFYYLGDGAWSESLSCYLGTVTDLEGDWLEDDEEAIRIAEFVNDSVDLADVPRGELAAYRQKSVSVHREGAAKTVKYWDDLLTK